MDSKKASSISVKVPIESLQEAISSLPEDEILLLKNTIERTLSARESRPKKKVDKTELKKLIAKTQGIWASDLNVEAALQYLGYEV